MNSHSVDTYLQSKDQFSDLSLQAETYSLAYHQGAGWSEPFPDADSAMTLVVVFADNTLWNDRSALDELNCLQAIDCVPAAELSK